MLDPGALNHHAADVLSWLATTSLSAAGIAVIVLAVQTFFGRWITPAWRYRLWGVLVLRLLLPALPASPASVANLALPDRVSFLWHRIADAHVAAPSADTSPSNAVTPPVQLPADNPSAPGITVTVVNGPRTFRSSPLPPVAPARPSPSHKLNIFVVTLSTWIIVAAFLFLRLLVANVALHKRLATALQADPGMLSLLRDCCAEMGIRRPPAVLVTSAVAIPAAAGVFKPRILLPPGLLETLSRPEQRTVLLHELAHIRRHDVAGNWLLALIQIVHWFNPVLWVALGRLRADRELARDAMVLSLSDRNDRRHYVDTLLKLTESLSNATFTDLLAPKTHVAVGMYGGKNGLKRRLQMISRIPESRRRIDWTGPVLAIVLVGALLTSAKSQTPDRLPKTLNARQTPTTVPSDLHAVKVPVLSEMPVIGRLFTTEAQGRPRAEQKLAPYNEVLPYPTDPPPAQPAPPPDAERQAVAQLQRQLPALTFDAVGFSDVIDFLRDVSGMNIFVNWKAVEEAKVDRNTPVSANLRNIKFSKALNVILDSVGGGQVKLGYTIDEGVLVITTADDLVHHVVTRVYDVRDLLALPPRNAARTNPAPATRPATREDLVDRLSNLIIDTIATSSWKERKGAVGTLRELEGQLIIIQTPENHRQISEFLALLREERQVQILVDARFITLDEQALGSLIDQWNHSSTPPRPVTRPSSAAGHGASPAQNRATDIFLTAEQMHQVMHLGTTSMLAAPYVLLANGQDTYVKISSYRSYLGEYSVVAKSNGEVRYEPVNKTVEPGIAMDLVAGLTDMGAVTLSLHPQVSALIGFTRAQWPGSPRNVELMVEQPNLKTSQFQTTVTIPDGITVLLGGLEDPGLTTDNTPTSRPSTIGRGLYILVTPTIIRQNPVEQKPFPLLTPDTRPSTR
jgi:beta-lactamase regulating signal transducer with metallopeptidase domain